MEKEYRLFNGAEIFQKIDCVRLTKKLLIYLGLDISDTLSRGL